MKPWEATIEVWGNRSWQWAFGRTGNPSIEVYSTEYYSSRQSARRAARRVMKRLGLVEKANTRKE